MYLKCFLLSLILISVSVFAQKQTVTDSLQSLILSEKQDTSKVLQYGVLSNYYLKNNIDSAQYFANKGLYLAKKIEYNKGIGDLYILLGNVKVIQNNMYQAMDHYLKAVESFIQSNTKEEISISYLLLGNVSYTVGNYPDALDYYQRGLHIADSLQLIAILPDFYNNLGEINSKLQNYDAAIVNFNKGLVIREDASNYTGAAFILVNLSRLYSVVDSVDKAQSYLASANKLYEKIQHNEGLLSVSHMYAELEQNHGNYGRAIEYYKNGYKYLEAIGSDYLGPISILRANYYSSIGYCYLMNKDYDLSEKNLLLGFEIAEQTGQIENMQTTAQYLSELYEISKQPFKALKYSKYFKIYSDSILQEKNIKKLTQLEMQFEFDKKMKQTELERSKLEARQNRRELILFMFIAGIFIGLVFFILLYLLQKNKSKRIDLKRKNLKLDLDFRNKELTTNVMYLLKKNEFIITISNKLKKSRYDFKPENRVTIDEIIREIETSTKEVNWKDFEIRFQEVHSKFYKKLNELHPNLSPNELKLSAFLRLNMSTKEISAITFQSYNSIMMARHRLRKKLGVDTNDSLTGYLRQL